MKEKNTPSLTMGTLATLPFLYFLGKFSPPFFLFIPFLIIATFASCVIAEITQNKLKLHDPGWIVMDEVLGMATTWLFYQSSHWSHLLVMFILFRAFDIFKVWPATFFDKNHLLIYFLYIIASCTNKIRKMKFLKILTIGVFCKKTPAHLVHRMLTLKGTQPRNFFTSSRRH